MRDGAGGGRKLLIAKLFPPRYNTSKEHFGEAGGNAVPMDMKGVIAQAAMTLLLEKHIKKLTVKDIVEECHITRQTFYYHFADIPEMFRWILEQQGQRVLLEAKAQQGGEAGLRSMFVMALEAMPYLRRAERTAYGRELQQLVAQSIENIFEKVIEERGLYAQCSRPEVKLIVRYHVGAILGLFQTWTDEDTQHLDDIVATVFRLMTEGIPPQGETRE